MGLFSNLFAGGAGTLVDQVGKVVDEFHLSAEEKQQLNIRLQELVLKREELLETSAQAEMSAKERVLVAELNQGDNYTKRARPTVVYAGLLLILLNYTVIPGIALLAGKTGNDCQIVTVESKPVQNCEPKFLVLPEEFWWAWAGIVGTWSIGRTAEKMGRGNKLTSLITGSAAPAAADDEAKG